MSDPSIGIDKITIGGDITRLNFDIGDGDDHVIVDGDVYERNLQTGPGDDVLEIGGTDFVRRYIDMGDGYDVFALRGPQSSYSIEYTDGHYIMNEYHQTHIYNAEAVVFADGVILVDGVAIDPIDP